MEWLAERIPTRLSRNRRAYMFELNSAEHAAGNMKSFLPPQCVCRVASRQELPACATITELPVNEYYRRFDAGDICYGVFVDNQPVNVNWVHSGSCFVRGMGYEHNGTPNDKYVYGIMTDPANRGKGLYKNCLVTLASELFANGADRIIQMVEDGNLPVLRALPQLGYRKIREIRHRAILGFNCTVVTDLTVGKTSVRRFMSSPSNLFVI